MWNDRFEGWYFKLRKTGKTVAFIPGRAESGAFVQVIANERSWHFDMPDLRADKTIRTGGCSFAPGGSPDRSAGNPRPDPVRTAHTAAFRHHGALPPASDGVPARRGQYAA